MLTFKDYQTDVIADYTYSRQPFPRAGKIACPLSVA